MKKKNIILIILISFVVITTSSTLAWFFMTKEVNGNLTPGKLNDSIKIDSYFQVLDNKIDSLAYKSNNLLVCDGSDYIKTNIDDSNYILNNKENNIKNLKIDVSYDAKISMCLRIKVQSNIVLQKYYYNTKTYRNSSIKEQSNVSSFTIDESVWYFDTNTRYYYYKKIINKNEKENVNFISGGKVYEVNTKSISYYENYIYNIALNVEAVQANRYSEVWNINDDFLK